MSGGTESGWRNTILAGLANYIDAGSIVATSIVLAVWQKQYGFSNDYVGLIAAFGANAIGAGIGALIGGRLCDVFGRKKIYQFDMLFYAFGMAFLVIASAPGTLAAGPALIVIGSVLVGLAVGADIPASWSLIAEQAPDKQRGAHSGVAQILWYLGPVMVLVAFFILDQYDAQLRSMGTTAGQIVFIHLLVLALALTFLRSKMAESQRWEETKKAEAASGNKAGFGQLFQPQYLKSMIFLILMYGLWNLWAGTNGVFMPYILEKVGGLPAWAVALFPALYFIVGIGSVFGVFMTLSDKVDQRVLFGIAAGLQVIGMAMPAVFGLSFEIALIHTIIMGFAAGFGAQSFFQLWSSEMFPTALRASAQGLTFAVVRIALGIWSLMVPALASTDYATLAWILTGFLIASGVIGTIWAPRNEGKSLEQLEAERQGAA
jgi:MFS transporter, SP family, inositol transporter